MTNIKIIGDQGSRKYDEGLVNKVNEQIEAEERRKRLEDKRKVKEQQTQEPQPTEKTKPNSQPIMLSPEDCIFLQATGHLSADGQSLYSYPDTMIAQDTMYPGLNWYQTHEVLQSQGLAMPTIRQEIDRLILINKGLFGLPIYDGNNGRIPIERVKQIWDKYFRTQQQGWNARWLDAQFKVDKTSGLWILNYEHISTIDPQEGQILTPKRIESLDAFVNEDDIRVDLFSSCNYQGLPTTKKTTNGHFYFRKPRDNSVARFHADTTIGAWLYCNWLPNDASASAGVTPTKEL